MNIVVASIFLIAVLLTFNNLLQSSSEWAVEKEMKEIGYELSKEITEFYIQYGEKNISASKTILIPKIVGRGTYILELSNSSRALSIKSGTSELLISLNHIPESIRLNGIAQSSSGKLTMRYNPLERELSIS
jgi:hypothetical protein